MRPVRTTLATMVLAGIVAAGSFLYAQPTPGDEDKAAEDTPDITVPMEKKAKISPREMTSKSDELIGDMKVMLKRVVDLQQVARKQNDVIKLNCVNDKLLQVKQLLNIAESARNDLTEAIASENEDARYHQYGQVTISSEKVTVLRDEAEACIGEELIFLGPTQVEVSRPPIVDDPTKYEPFNLTDVDIERPAYATPYL